MDVNNTNGFTRKSWTAFRSDKTIGRLARHLISKTSTALWDFHDKVNRF